MEGVFGGQQAGVGEMRHEAERRPAALFLDEFHAAGEERRVAAKPVDDEAAHERRVLRIDDNLRADDLRDHAAAVDIAHEHDRNACGAREAHVGDVVGAQIDFGGRSRALDHNEIGLPLQQRWNLARRKLERARAAQHRAEHYLGIWGSPDALLLAANAHALEPLGYEAQRAPLRTYAIIHGFLENLIAGIERDACALERLGKNAAAGRPTSMSEIKKTARALERRAEAFEFVDIALSEIVDESLEKGGAS